MNDQEKQLKNANILFKVGIIIFVCGAIFALYSLMKSNIIDFHKGNPFVWGLCIIGDCIGNNISIMGLGMVIGSIFLKKKYSN